MNGLTPKQVRALDLSACPPGAVSAFWLHIINNGLGEAIRIPVMVARGAHDGPVLGLTAALHGNELNGIPIIQELIHGLDLSQLRGTVVGALALNVPGLIREQRVFNDGVDLNHIAPGKPNGNISQIYIHRIIDRIICHLDYLIDLHTASFGRVNCFYIRADMDDERTARLARLQGPDIIVHNPPNDTTLRGTAASMGIPAITAELRDPHVFQREVIEHGLVGIRNVLYDLGMLEGMITCPVRDSILCEGSFWMFTDEGGLLTVFPEVTDEVKAGDLVGRVQTIFGTVTKEYHAPIDGIVIGRSVNPINQTGSRIVHLGRSPRPIPCITVDDEHEGR